MDGQLTSHQKQDSANFLLEEYKQLYEAFLFNEQLGERRVNFFITLTTAVIAALAAGSKAWEIDQMVVSFALVAVFLFGIVTLVRIIRRNIVTDDCIRGLGRIRKYFAQRDPKIEPFLPYPPCDDKARIKKWKDILSLGTGGLVEMVELVNSLVLGAIFALSVTSDLKCDLQSVIDSALIGFCIAYIGQFKYVMYRYNKRKEEIEKEIRFPYSNGD